MYCWLLQLSGEEGFANVDHSQTERVRHVYSTLKPDASVGEANAPQTIALATPSSPSPMAAAQSAASASATGDQRASPELIARFHGGAALCPPPAPHCQRWHVQRGANADQAWWLCVFCRCIIMRVGRRFPGDETGYHDVQPCAKSSETLDEPAVYKPRPVKRSQTSTGIVTPPYPWPRASLTLEGLVVEGDRQPRPKAKAKAKAKVQPDPASPKKPPNKQSTAEATAAATATPVPEGTTPRARRGAAVPEEFSQLLTTVRRIAAMHPELADEVPK